jgi:hypothetical protein
VVNDVDFQFNHRAMLDQHGELHMVLPDGFCPDHDHTIDPADLVPVDPDKGLDAHRAELLKRR